MADIMAPPAPGIAVAGAARPKPDMKSKVCDSITIRRAGNGFIVEKGYEGGGPMEKPSVAPTLETAIELATTALGGSAPIPTASPDAMAGAPEESGMPPTPPAAPAEEPGVRYDEGGEPPEPNDEKY